MQVPVTWALGSAATGTTLAGQAPPLAPDNFMVSDARGLGAASPWSVSVSLAANTNLTPSAPGFNGPGPTGTNPLGAVTYDPSPTGTGFGPPSNSSGGTFTTSGPVTLTGTPQPILTTTNSPGLTTWTPGITVVIPAAAPTGAYQAVLDTSVTAG